MPIARRPLRNLRGLLVALLASACSGSTQTHSSAAVVDPTIEVQRATLSALVGSTRFVTREHFIAAGLAGTDAVPSGDFTLTLGAVDRAEGQPTQAHGTLTLQSPLKAPPQTDCGSGDIEAVTVQL